MSNISEIETIYDIYKSFKNHQFGIPSLCIKLSMFPKKFKFKSYFQVLQTTLMLLLVFLIIVTGYEASLASIALGAKIIEKHFTLDKSLKGPDHKASADPREFHELVEQIRKVEKMLGDPYKKIQEEENEMYSFSRKSLHLKEI